MSQNSQQKDNPFPVQLLQWGICACAFLPYALVALLIRFVIFRVFFFSAQTKIDGFSITPATFYLFQYEYALPIIPYKLAAYAGTIGEFALSILLLVGLATRFAAFGLIVMTLTIQYVYPDAWWSVHVWWLLVLLVLVSKGGGTLSLDYLLKDMFGSPSKS
ncbi:MAG: DoxX family protein [Hyphomicrobiales bacterium]|nr:DoxX family protein [Hyphomicrobiales bacterium]MCY4048042.1 DoxX family protein [Hyphomicrobiales bacterium]MCY4052306.1 DoxX family protein [Hyphomicrobiales bacterium]